MKVALITTTINIPKVLALYRKLDDGVFFFITGDRKSPDIDITNLLFDIPNHLYLGLNAQHNRGYQCSTLIGPDCIQRKNIALLDAVRWGADVILTTDDDNFPIDRNFFADLRRDFEFGFDGIEVSSPNGWFDPGQLLTPTVRHRGLPLAVPSVSPELRTVVDAKVGVVAGLWVGDGDVDATHRIALPPAIHSATALAEAGVVVAHDTKAVFNAQNVAFRRELAPAMFLAPGLGRSDDIFASLICQRVMRDQGMQVRYGKPFTACWQDRSTQSLLNDLRDEQFGMQHVAMFANYLDKNPLNGRSCLEYVRWLYTDLQSCVWWPARASECALAFLDDLERGL